MLMDEPVEQTIEQTDTISEIITITIMTSTGSQQISAFLSDKVHKILNQTGKKSLTLDGDKLDPDQTLDELGITDGDVIDAI
jgi:adenylylsulfate kinase-like enzyme